MASKFVMLCFSLMLSAVMTPSLAAAPPPLPSWEPLPTTPPPPPTKNVTQQDINSICSTAQDPKFCQQIISAIPETNRTNLKDLQTSVINESLAIFNESLKAFPLMIDSTKEPALKDALEMCHQHYYNAREDFMDGIKLMNKKVFYIPNYHAVIDLMKNAILELNTCEIDLQLALNNKSTTPFTNKNNELIPFAHLVSAVGKYLYEWLRNSASA